MSTATTGTVATLADLARIDAKAELVDGRIIPIMPTGEWPGRVAARISNSLDGHATQARRGLALFDGVGCSVPRLTSGRESFCPDAAYYDHLLPSRRMRFVVGPPTLAVEVRSENDYGPAAERAMATKRADYFQAGTLVVWDVDPEADRIQAYRREAPDRPVTFTRGEVAEAEPAVPGWRVAVDDLFA